MSTEPQHGNPKIRTVPASTELERQLGGDIVTEMLGNQFVLETEGYPRNVGVQGDKGIYGETVCIRPLSSDAARFLLTQSHLHSPHSEEDVLGRVSIRLTNSMPAVTKVMFDITVPEEV